MATLLIPSQHLQLQTKIREIAIEAIGRTVRGNPSDAAAQLLKGIAILDGVSAPFLIWPQTLSPDEQIQFLELELKKTRDGERFITDKSADSEDAGCELAPKLDPLKTKAAVVEPKLPDQALPSPVDAVRSPRPAEIETLQALLSESLIEVWEQVPEKLTATAAAFGMAVRVAFDELYGPVTAVSPPIFSG